jgi:hypothetical protein
MTSQKRHIARATNCRAHDRRRGDDHVRLDSSLFSLNATASVLWEAADGVTPLAEIVEQRICTAFDVDHALALHDAEELAADLARHGILRLSDSPMPEAAAPPKDSP